MLKELGLVVTGVTIGVVGTLYVTKDFLIEGFAHKVSEAIDEEVQDMKDELYNEQVEKDNKRDYTKPLRRSGKYPWGENKDNHADAEETYALPMLIHSYEDAVKVLSTLTEMIIKHDVVSIEDYYDLVGVTPTYKDTLYGWTGSDLTDARIVASDSEYSIVLPAAKRLNK